MTDTSHITIYSDGGCKPNPGPGGWGAVLLADDGTERALSGSDPDTTNNRMELTAAIEALRALPGPMSVTFFTDSQYVRNGITKWLAGWIARGWQRAGDQPVLNEDLWRALHAETKRHSITWQWVRGHAGNRYNERVDQLATAARERLTGKAPAASAPITSAVEPEIEIALRVSVPKSGGTGGWAIRFSGTPPTLVTGREAKTTSNRLELAAALEALRRVPAGTAVRVYCSSDYLYNGMTQWIAGWQKRNWQTADRKPVKHQDLWRALADEAQRRPVEWIALRGPTPTLARGLDTLATKAIQG